MVEIFSRCRVWPQSILGISFWVLSACLIHAQTTPDSTAASAEEDYSAYGDADAPSASYATQKVLYLSPTRLISVGYEAQTQFDLETTGYRPGTEEKLGTERSQPTMRGIRLQTNTPIISRSNLIVNVGLSYWNSGMRFPTRDTRSGPNYSEPLLKSGKGIRTGGLQATVFKPFNNRHFLIFQAQGDVSGNYLRLDEIDGRDVTVSGTALFGWKKSDNLMFGFGATRTYRAGQVLHIPVVMFNRTFSRRWGIEAILPARAALRYNFSPSSMLLLGYEIEGNAFHMRVDSTILSDSFRASLYPRQDVWLRRGELKPRLGYEQKLIGFVWLAVQAGVRYNYRFKIHDSKDPKGENLPLFTTKSGLPFYANISINLVSP